MDAVDRVQLLAELEGAHCELNHGPDTNPADYPAIDYIVIPFGYKKDAGEDVSVRDLVIPVCLECAQALVENEWTLLYCFECSRSHWVFRARAKNGYRHHILWLRGCPDCSNQFGGLYFNDVNDAVKEAEFVANTFKSAA